MLKEFLKNSVSLVAGKPSENIVDVISDKKYINEFLIAKKLDLTVNQVRNILYKLSDEGLVSSIRKKDKRKGWYTYFWQIEPLKALEFLKANVMRRANQIKTQIESREAKTFYVCNRCNVEYNEENALLNDFTCNECGDIFVIKDNTKLLRELKKNLEKQNKEIESIDVEIDKEKEVIEKRKQKEMKKEEKKTAKAKKKTVKKPAKKKTAKKTTKKKATKKPAKKKVIKKKPLKKAAKKKAVVKTKKTSAKKTKPKKRK